MTFELNGAVIYKIWQEGGHILLDIQASSEGFSEVDIENQTKDVIKERLKAMDSALKEFDAGQLPIDSQKSVVSENIPAVSADVKVAAERPGEVQQQDFYSSMEKPAEVKFSSVNIGSGPKSTMEDFSKDTLVFMKNLFSTLASKTVNENLPLTTQMQASQVSIGSPSQKEYNHIFPSVKELFSVLAKVIGQLFKSRRMPMPSILYWVLGIILAFGAGFIFWHRYLIIKQRNSASTIESLEVELQDKNKLLEQQEILRKAIEATSLQKEKECEQLKGELETFKESVIKKELPAEELFLAKEEEKPMGVEEGPVVEEKPIEEKPTEKGSIIEGKKPAVIEELIKEKEIEESAEKEPIIDESPAAKRQHLRLDLSRDFNRTIIVRIDGADRSKSVKSFANDISLGGLCFETRREFKLGEKINLRLFFFGDRVAMMKIPAQILWKKVAPPVNYYGVSFILLDEKAKAALKNYIDSKMTKS